MRDLVTTMQASWMEGRKRGKPQASATDAFRLTNVDNMCQGDKIRSGNKTRNIVLTTSCCESSVTSKWIHDD